MVVARPKFQAAGKYCTLLRLHPASLSTDAAEFCPMRAFASPVALFVVDSVGDIRYTLDRPGPVGMRAWPLQHWSGGVQHFTTSPSFESVNHGMEHFTFLMLRRSVWANR